MGGSQKKIRGLLRLYKYTCYILCRIKYHTLSTYNIYKIPIIIILVIIIIVTMTWMRNKKFNVLLLLPSSSPKPRGRRDTVEDDDDGRPILYTTESLRVVHTQARSSTRWRRGKIIRSNTVGPDTQRALFLRADNPTRLPPRESRIVSNRIVVGSPGWRSHDQSLIHDPVLLCAECDFNPRSSSPRLL